MNENIEEVKLLVNNGADVNAKDCHSKSPLNYAAENNLDEIV